MKDIDFDELDRAVTSLLGSSKTPESQPAESKRAPQTPEKPANPPVSTISSNTTAQVSSPKPPTETPPSAKLPIAPQRPFRASAPSHSPEAPPVKSVPVSRPNGGGSRFMDVVPPNATKKPDAPRKLSKMPTSSLTPPASHKPSLSPATSRTDSAPAEASKPSSFMDSLIPRRSKRLSDDKPKHDADAPDLLTAHAGHPADEEQKLLERDVPPVLLPNPKIEKRPLGGKSVMRDEKKDNDTKQLSPLDDDVKPLKTPEPAPLPLKKVSDSETTLPPELDEKLVAVEASEPVEDLERPDTPPAYPEERTPRAGVTTEREVSKMATASIPQQYRPKTTAPDPTPRSIYDTEEYHAPLPAAPPAKKKKHPLMWVFLVLILLLIGAGLGVGAYFLLG